MSDPGEDFGPDDVLALLVEAHATPVRDGDRMRRLATLIARRITRLAAVEDPAARRRRLWRERQARKRERDRAGRRIIVIDGDGAADELADDDAEAARQATEIIRRFFEA